ncbi:hypothetical protein V8G54_022094 [Vigna mungo]|uniref:Uncharacterized protein n=1 Tax=Vigna mungo TaxID=3915 RepID=A0AAQ3RXI4_VIGMU
MTLSTSKIVKFILILLVLIIFCEKPNSYIACNHVFSNISYHSKTSLEIYTLIKQPTTKNLFLALARNHLLDLTLINYINQSKHNTQETNLCPKVILIKIIPTRKSFTKGQLSWEEAILREVK